MKKAILEQAMAIVERAGGYYELFTSADDVKAFIGDPSDLDYPMPEIWKKRIKACEEILAENKLPCIFDTMEAVVASVITPDGFTFDGKHYE